MSRVYSDHKMTVSSSKEGVVLIRSRVNGKMVRVDTDSDGNMIVTTLPNMQMEKREFTTKAKLKGTSGKTDGVIVKDK